MQMNGWTYESDGQYNTILNNTENLIWVRLTDTAIITCGAQEVNPRCWTGSLEIYHCTHSTHNSLVDGLNSNQALRNRGNPITRDRHGLNHCEMCESGTRPPLHIRMISAPQNDLRHTPIHVGHDGTVLFGTCVCGSLHAIAPSYLSSLLCHYAPSDRHLLSVPRIRTSIVFKGFRYSGTFFGTIFMTASDQLTLVPLSGLISKLAFCVCS